jgi:molybdate transport system ATP-binding protein
VGLELGVPASAATAATPQAAANPGPVRLLSRISQASALRLALTPGMPVFAQIKGVALVR